MEQRQPAAGVDVDQGKGGRVHARCDAQPAGQALDELRLARAQVAGQADDQAARRGAAPLLAERGGLGGAMRNGRSHEPSAVARLCLSRMVMPSPALILPMQVRGSLGNCLRQASSSGTASRLATVNSSSKSSPSVSAASRAVWRRSRLWRPGAPRG